MASLGSQAPHCLKYAIFAGSSKDSKMDEKVLKYVVKVVRDTRHDTLLFGQLKFTLVMKTKLSIIERDLFV